MNIGNSQFELFIVLLGHHTKKVQTQSRFLGSKEYLSYSNKSWQKRLELLALAVELGKFIYVVIRVKLR